jgi:hypothetical protein
MTSPTAVSAARASSARSPLWAVLVFAFLGSLGTGVVTNGIYFMTKHAYGFSVAQNYLLGLTLGGTYIAAALGAGPLLSWLNRSRLSTRTVLLVILLSMGAMCSLPLAMDRAGLGHHQWPIWVLILIYSPLTGLHWPLVESFLSGGRSGAPLRSAIGRFNITWSSALVVGLIGIRDLVEHHAAEGIAILGAVHLVSIALLPVMGKEPGKHLEDEHEPHPPVYRQLLVVFRVLLPTSYLVSTALIPFLPSALTRLEISNQWQTPIAAVYTAARMSMFILLERWHGWHGRWYPAVGGMILLVGGFALTVLSPVLGSGSAGIAAVVIGLTGFGAGMAAIYAGALYYAMEVGKAEVSAGGMHEALIGVGYTIGPLCGLAAGGAVAAQVVPKDRFDAVMIGLVAAISGLAMLVAVRWSWRAIRKNGRDTGDGGASATSPITGTGTDLP